MMVRVILYKTKHGSTRKIGKVINQYIGDCLLMNLNDVDYSTLEQADMIIIAGDIYDKPVPPAEAVVLFDNFLNQLAELKVPVCIISGNHDSAERLVSSLSVCRIRKKKLPM